MHINNNSPDRHGAHFGRPKSISIKHGRKRSNTTHTHEKCANGWHNTNKHVGEAIKWEIVIKTDIDGKNTTSSVRAC